MSSSSDSESDVEERARLKAAAVDFSVNITDRLPQTNPCNQTEHIKSSQNTEVARDYSNQRRQVSNKPSKRTDQGTDQDNVHELQTTPEFRSHVANKLSEAICSNIKMKPVWTAVDDSNSSMSGIKLFSSSKPITNVATSMCNNKLPTKKRKIDSESSDSSDDEAALASVVVSGEFILTHGSIPNSEPVRDTSNTVVTGHQESNDCDELNKNMVKEERHKKKKKRASEET